MTGWQYLKECLPFIRQNYREYEAIVVDNNSIEGSQEYAYFPSVKPSLQWKWIMTSERATISVSRKQMASILFY